ncbi:acid-sensing ion channel 1-like, partial [Saccostrea cucullata]|uniref:acid-sensing ion channel 1-like n=1 Tax=Saccostrea cuccullata TaxID=36930 RepID=UPI002ED23762
QTLYQSTISGRVWPKESFLVRIKYFLRSPKSLSFRDNFLKLVIYYEDTNYEEISEEPSYDGFRFLSDLGGAMGLFLGASVLSFLELVQLFVELSNYLRRKCLQRKNKVNESPNNTVNPTKDTKDSKNIFTVAMDERDNV